MKDIYIIICRNRKNDDWTTINVSQVCYDNKKDAIKFVECRLNKEELEFNEKAHNRNLQPWFEYFGDNYTYYIKVLELH